MKSWILVGFVVVAAACGDGGGGTGEQRVPSAGDPAFGAIGHVLVSDRFLSHDATQDRIWIGFNRQDQWDALLALQERFPNEYWIGGRIVVAPSRPLGFYFDPNRTLVGEVAAEGIQTTLDDLKQDPVARAAQDQNWAVVAVVDRVVPGTP